MSELNGQEIVSQIAIKLRNRFSTSEFVEIYRDKPNQSMKTPCIFIHSVDTSYTPDLKNYGWWDFIVDIRCHPGKLQTNVHSWCRLLGPIITECVHSLPVSNQEVKVRDSEWKVEDGVAHVIVKYKMRVYRVPETVPTMQTLTYGERIKE